MNHKLLTSNVLKELIAMQRKVPTLPRELASMSDKELGTELIARFSACIACQESIQFPVAHYIECSETAAEFGEAYDKHAHQHFELRPQCKAIAFIKDMNSDAACVAESRDKCVVITQPDVEAISDKGPADIQQAFYPVGVANQPRHELIQEVYNQYCDYQFWIMHQYERNTINVGEWDFSDECLPRLEQDSAQAERIEGKYGRENLKSNTFMHGVVLGRMTALAWLLGAGWEDSMYWGPTAREPQQGNAEEDQRDDVCEETPISPSGDGVP
jgi:hypothetical protein